MTYVSHLDVDLEMFPSFFSVDRSVDRQISRVFIDRLCKIKSNKTLVRVAVRNGGVFVCVYVCVRAHLCLSMSVPFYQSINRSGFLSGCLSGNMNCVLLYTNSEHVGIGCFIADDGKFDSQISVELFQHFHVAGEHIPRQALLYQIRLSQQDAVLEDQFDVLVVLDGHLSTNALKKCR